MYNLASKSDIELEIFLLNYYYRAETILCSPLYVRFNAALRTLRTRAAFTSGSARAGEAFVAAASRDTKRTATMADISLYLTNVTVSVGQNMAVQQVGERFSLCLY